MEPLQLRAHLHAQLRVEIRERLVEQEGDGLADQGPRERDALPLAAGQFARPARQQRRARHGGGRLVDAPSHLVARNTRRARNPKPMFSATVRCGNSA